jgi:glycine cleavage system transcriptional repressor
MILAGAPDTLADMPQLIITAIGPDRPGMVGELTSHLHKAGGNIIDSRMVNLRGEFAMLILLECVSASIEPLRRDVSEVGKKMGLHLEMTEQRGAQRIVQGLPFRLKTYSMDQPGIVARLSHILRAHGVNIEELSARQESAPFAGTPLFLTEFRLTVPATAALGKLRADLESVGAELNCDIDLDPG